MSLHLRPLTVLDLLSVCRYIVTDELGQEHAFLGQALDSESRALRTWHFPGPKWAVADESEQAIAAGGFIEKRPGVAESWFLSTSDTWKHADVTDLVKSVKDGALVETYHRVETVSLASRERAHRWYARLGMQKEATLKKYCADGQDAVLFVSTRETV